MYPSGSAGAPAPIPVCPSCGVIAPIGQNRCPLCDTGFGETPPFAAGGIVGAVFARVRLDFTCPACGSESPLPPSLTEQVECQACRKWHELPSPQWHSALELAHAVADLCLGRGPAVPQNQYQGVGKKRCFAQWRGRSLHVQASPGHPLCAACHAPLDMRRGSEGEWQAVCAQCEAHAQCHLPERADFVAPSLLSVVDVSPHGQAVALQCPACGGPLSVAEGSELGTCPYCNTTSRVQRRAQSETFWVLLQGESAERRRLEQALVRRPEPSPKRAFDYEEHEDIGARFRRENRSFWRWFVPIMVSSALFAIAMVAINWPRDRLDAWDENHTLMCSDETVTLEHKSVSLPDGVPAGKWGGVLCKASPELCPLIIAARGCNLKIISCTLRAPMVLNVHGGAHVVLQNSLVTGRVESTGQVVFQDSVVEGDLYADGDARIEFRGSTLKGELDRRDNSQVIGLPASDGK